MKKGFTLIELLVALSITTLLFCLAGVSYVTHIAHVDRDRAEIVLMQLSEQLETYASEHAGSYAGATMQDLQMDIVSAQLPYRFSIAALSDTEFTLMAEPRGSQAVRDALCGVLTLTALNIRGAANAGCWQ